MLVNSNRFIRGAFQASAGFLVSSSRPFAGRDEYQPKLKTILQRILAIDPAKNLALPGHRELAARHRLDKITAGFRSTSRLPFPARRIH